MREYGCGCGRAEEGGLWVYCSCPVPDEEAVWVTCAQWESQRESGDDGNEHNELFYLFKIRIHICPLP